MEFFAGEKLDLVAYDMNEDGVADKCRVANEKVGGMGSSGVGLFEFGRSCAFSAPCPLPPNC